MPVGLNTLNSVSYPKNKLLHQTYCDAMGVEEEEREKTEDSTTLRFTVSITEKSRV